MSISRHHADWLNLVEHSGPFFSLPVLSRVFSHGLDPRDTAQAKRLREAYEVWQDNPTAPGKQHAWVMHVLTDLLGYPEKLIAEGQAIPPGLEARMAEMGETLRPDLVLLTPVGRESAGQAQMLISFYPPEQQLDKPVVGKHWKATPTTRMMELLHGAGIPLGLATNGEQWMLVYAPRGETTGYASWYASLWLDEPITLRAFHSLLGTHRFFGVADANTPLGMLKESTNDQQEVTDQLGYQVREAVEVLVQSFDALDKVSGRKLLHGVAESALYDAALTVMMRLVFLFSAEERGMLQLGKPLYDDNYAVSTLQELLQEVADRYGEEVLERRTDAWARLLASFRSVHGGVHHQDLSMPAYGGSLFDPDRFPFLEGRVAGTSWKNTVAEPLAINNRVVLHLLNALQRLRVKGAAAGGLAETRRVSFRALGVEQIGHVYEGLLDHTAISASEPVLGLKGSSKKEPEVALTTLEGLLAKGEDKLIAFLKEETGRSPAALKKLLTGSALLDEHKLLIACGQDQDLLGRVRPFAGLVREDSFERPLVVLPRSFYVTAGTTRRSTGTHYTPPSLTEPVVRHTLEPLVYQGPAEGWPREQWKLKSPKEILELKVCDMAMGSGAFLVQVCRYLAERLVEAWENEEHDHPDEVLITPEGGFFKGELSERLIPVDPGERLAIARRVVADRSLYGVDINPMAVEMAKLSLWLITMDPKRPFSFLDHAFKCGDSLLGITSLEQLECFSLRSDGGKQKTFATLNLWRHIDEAKAKRIALESMPSDTPEQIAAKASLYREAEEAVAKLSSAADVLVSVELKGLKGQGYVAERETSADHMMLYWSEGLAPLNAYARKRLGERRCIHWALAYPEVMARGGFDAFVGNPPFLGGGKIESAFGSKYRAYLVDILARSLTGVRGSADFCTYFLLRAEMLCRVNSLLGLIVTNSLGQGDAREVGLAAILNRNGKIIRANPSFSWPGQATVIVSVFWLYIGTWRGGVLVDDVEVEHIDASMHAANAGAAEPMRLRANEEIAFEGAKLSGEGFVVPGDQARKILDLDKKYAKVLRPYLTGSLVNSAAKLDPKDYVITFYDWPLSKENSPVEYTGPVAVDFNVCLDWVFEKVKPQREKLSEATPWNRKLKTFWWHFGQWRWALDKALDKSDNIFVLSRVTPYLIVEPVSKDWVYSDRLTVFACKSNFILAILNSSVHAAWAWRYGTTNLTLLSYSPAACFLTFPLPAFRKGEDGLISLVNEIVSFRRLVAESRKIGLTDLYNKIHNSQENSDDVTKLRKLYSDLDTLVTTAYGWKDIVLGHGFHETKQGIRYTISDAARREVLDRLLVLNHQRYAEEVAAGLHDKKSGKTAGAGKRGRKQVQVASPQVDMFSQPGLFEESLKPAAS